MTVNELIRVLNATPACVPDGEAIVSGGYAGDLLSYVMGRAPSGAAWFTIMTNVNVCAVATLTEVAVVVICDGCKPNEPLVNSAKTRGVNVICTDLDVFHAIERVNDANQL